MVEERAKNMKKDLLVYDVDWWVLGKHARIIKQHYPELEIMSQEEFFQQLQQYGADYFNENYDVISTLCLGIARILMSNGVRVDSSAAVSYYYFMKNQQSYREWMDDPIYDYDFIKDYVSKIKSIGAINPNLAQLIKNISPSTNVKYIKQFVDSDQFKPMDVENNPDDFVIGWVGDTEKMCKNYYTAYLPIVEICKHHMPNIAFKEATMKSYVSPEKMPDFYNSLDLLLITGNNEGGPATALEAYACGVPVLSSNIGYVKAVTHPSAHEFIMESNHPIEYITKINEITQNRKQLKEIAKSCHEYVNENFTIKNTIPDWINQLFYLE
jgi:glycosyltransferase involved in cell wall biosynthesis